MSQLIRSPILLAALLGGCVYAIPDYAHRSKGMHRPAKIEYHTWISSGNVNSRGECTFTIFALVTRERLTRLRINGTEQLVDWSWSWEAKVPEGHHASGMVVEFIDPVSRKVMATHDIWAKCPWKNEVVY